MWSIARHVGTLRDVIARYKYRGGTAWSSVLGRILAGYLLEHSPWFEEFQLIAPNPGYVSRWRSSDHVGRIVDAAAEVAGNMWPFDTGPDRCVVKTAPTVALMHIGAPARRRLCAATELRSALLVPHPARVAGRHVLVVDDVLTDGSTLREVALALRAAGAAGVSGLVLARQPWTRANLGPAP